MVVMIGNIFVLKFLEKDLGVVMFLVELVIEVGFFLGVFNIVYGIYDVVN